MKKNTVISFVAQFKAAITGDSTGVKAEKAWRQANSAINAQIYTLKCKTVGLENNVDRAKEKLALARVNGGEPIENDNVYVNNLIETNNNVLFAQKQLKRHIELIEFLTKELEVLSMEIEVESEE